MPRTPLRGRGADRRLPPLPAPGRVARGGGGRPAAPLPGPGLLGATPARASGTHGPGSCSSGSAPAAHGANRTGRVFTGDRSGEWLYASLHRAGLANRPARSVATTGCGCSAPTSPPSTAARLRQSPDSRRARQLPPLPGRRAAPLDRASVIVALGVVRLGWLAPRDPGARPPRSLAPSRGSATAPRRPSARYSLIGCYHPSQQNTFTGQAHRDDARRRVRSGPGAGRARRERSPRRSRPLIRATATRGY